MQLKYGDNFSIQSWMVTGLELSGNELLVYAIIYRDSQWPDSRFTGSLNYLASWLNVTKQTVLNVLKRLVAKGLIKKFETIENGITFCEYQCILE